MAVKPLPIAQGESARDDLRHVVDRIERKLDELSSVVGFAGHDEHGGLIGAGVAGDLARLKAKVDARFTRDDGRMRYLAGAAGAASLFAAATWWLIQTRLEALLP